MTPSTRRLPYAPRPVPGEGFASYVDRVAAGLRVPLQSLLAATGLVEADHHRSLPDAYGVYLRPQARLDFAHATWLAPEIVDQMLLATYDGGPIDLRGLDMNVPSTLSVVARREWAYFAGSHVCPRCVAQQTAWALRWKLPWSFACVAHGDLLVPECGSCGYRCGVARRDGRLGPGFATHVPQPGRCGNPEPSGAAAGGRAARRCGRPLSTITAYRLPSGSPVLAAQATLDAMTDGPSAGSRDAFRALRSLTALILYAAEIEDLTLTDAPVVAAWERHVAGREQKRADRQLLLRSGHDSRRGPRSRPWTAVPQDPALMAAVAPAALRLLPAGSPTETADAAAALFDRVSRRAGRRLTVVPDEMGFPPVLADAFRAWQAATARKFVHRDAAQRGGRLPLTAAQVPELFWKDVYSHVFAPMLADVGALQGRRFCSLYLVRGAEHLSWTAAGELLGWPAHTSLSVSNQCVTALGRSGRDADFRARMQRFAESLAADGKAVDFGERRRRLRSLYDLPVERWRRLCAESAVHPGKGDTRRLNAAAWVWAEATSGDWRRSPSFRPRDCENAREVYRRHEPIFTGPMLAPLTANAAELCTPVGAPLRAQPTRADASATTTRRSP